MTPAQELEHKEQQLHKHLRALGPMAVAYSGGLDSRFLSYTALSLGLDIVALHVTGPHIPAQESRQAEQWAREHGLALHLLPLDPLQDANIAANSPERCYYCKSAVFHALLGQAGGRALCDGTNASDSEVYRPGMRALQELNIVSPLALAGLSKTEIRALARKNGMDRPEQAAHPCLFTRYNYGVRPTHASLAALDKAEEAVEAVLQRLAVGVPGASGEDACGETVPFRLRFEEADRAVLHVACAELPDAVRHALAEALNAAGFADSPVVLVEQISGHFDRVRQAQS